MNETKIVWIAYTNTDCTEGRGYDVPIAVCEAEATARRLAKGRYVQGGNGPVRKSEMVKIEGKWYAPGAAVNIITPTREDDAEQRKIDAKKAAIQRAKDAGLTDDEIAQLRA